MTQFCEDVCVCHNSMLVQHGHLSLQNKETTQLRNVALPSLANVTSDKPFPL